MTDSWPQVMIVGDDPGVRVTLEGIIAHEGLRVVGAEDGYKAIELAARTPFPLILMDIRMPGINGVETYREIKKISPQSTVVVMTGFAVRHLVLEAENEGAYAVLQKPFDIRQLIDITHEVFEPASWPLAQRQPQRPHPPGTGEYDGWRLRRWRRARKARSEDWTGRTAAVHGIEPAGPWSDGPTLTGGE